MTSSARSASWTALTAAVLAGAAAYGRPVLSYSIPTPIHGGETVEIPIRHFISDKMVCSAFISGVDAKSDEVPCGNVDAVLRLIPPLGLSVSKVYVGISACTGSLKAHNPNTECWSYGGDVNYTTEPSPNARPVSSGARAGGSAPAAAPAPGAGGIGDGAPPLLRSNDAPAQSAATGSHWSAESPAKPAPPQPAAIKPPGSRQFRGHDGRVYERETPAKGTVADKDERYRTALAADPAVREAFDNWRNLDDAGRQSALQRMSDIQAASYGIAPSPVVLSPGGKPGEVAHYDPSDRKMTMNTSSPYYNSPSMQVNAISHEARHRWQHALTERAPSLPPGSEERVLGEAFKVSFDNYCSVGGVRDCDYATYRNQLVERDAFDQGEAAALYLRSQR